MGLVRLSHNRVKTIFSNNDQEDERGARKKMCQKHSSFPLQMGLPDLLGSAAGKPSPSA